MKTHALGSQPYRRLLLPTMMVFALIASMSCAVARAEVTPQDTDAAIDKAVAFLLAQQHKDGSWEVAPKAAPGGPGGNFAWGGETAVVTYALCSAGQLADDPPIKKAIRWLEGEELLGTYAVGLRSQVWNLLPPKSKDRDAMVGIERDKEFLLFSRGLRGPGNGFYTYSYGNDEGLTRGVRNAPLNHAGSNSTGGDRSNSQYGVYGASALEHAGAEIPPAYWIDEDEAWKRDQNPDGGWGYAGKGSPSTATMTAAGVATLYIAQYYIFRNNLHQFDICKGGIINPAIEKGIAWLDQHADEFITRATPYGLHDVARVSVASGRKYFGGIDWYKAGAERLVKTQATEGSWGSPHDTSFCLLFLVRGREPVMMSKLIYDAAPPVQLAPWNERPRDIANLASFMGRSLCMWTLNWQTLELKTAVDQSHDAPILYISGSGELVFNNQDIDKLRRYVEEGGMILGNADCGSVVFSQSFRQLGAKLFPKCSFRELPASHLVYSEQYPAKKWKSHPVIEGMSNGIRELMILIPSADPARAWQTEASKSKEEMFQLAANIFLYAVGRDVLLRKGETYIVRPQGLAGREIKVARIAAGDNWDPEPGAWRRLAAVMHNVRHVEIKAEPVKLGAGLLSTFKVAHLTGTTKLTLDASQENELKGFVDKGGTLIVDAAGGSTDFADSAEAALRHIWGSAAPGLDTPLPPDHILYTTPGAKVETTRYRVFARRLLVGNLRNPRIKTVTVDKGRIGVFFSREDLTEGLVGEPIDGVVGYSPETATQLMSNMVMYADLGGMVVAPATH